MTYEEYRNCKLLDRNLATLNTILDRTYKLSKKFRDKEEYAGKYGKLHDFFNALDAIPDLLEFMERDIASIVDEEGSDD